MSNVLTAEQKAEIKSQAKKLGINVVGKSLEKLQALIAEKNDSLVGNTTGKPGYEVFSPEPVNPKLAQVREMAKVLGIPLTKTTPYADIRFAIADLKGWANEPEEVIDFLINGGAIEEVPGFTGIAPKPNNRETSAGGKVAPEPAKKTPRRVSKSTGEAKPFKTSTAKKATDPNATSITIQDICKELGIEDRIARRKLRTSDIVKPALGWYWEAGHADIQRVKELLK